MNPIRKRIERVMGETPAFLRCDRDEAALYVTNLPARCAAWRDTAAALEAQGMRTRTCGQLIHITPVPEWAEPFERWAAGRAPESELTRCLIRRRGCPVCNDELLCWLEGMKRLELNDAGGYEKRVRQTAAAALRKKCGGLLFCCGLCLDLMGGKEL